MYKVKAKTSFNHDQLGRVESGQEVEVNKAQLLSIKHLIEAMPELQEQEQEQPQEQEQGTKRNQGKNKKKK